MEYERRLLLFLMIVFLLWFYLGTGAQLIEPEGESSLTSVVFYNLDANLFRMEKENNAMKALVEEIIRRESGGDTNICNLQYGCSAGAGLTGIIPSTLKSCEIGLGRNLDVFNPEDNKACAYWLLETRGIWPWQPYSGDYSTILIKLGLYEEMW